MLLYNHNYIVVSSFSTDWFLFLTQNRAVQGTACRLCALSLLVVEVERGMRNEMQ